MTTRWHLNVPDDIDRDVRMLLGRRGFKKGDLSRFVLQAVKREILRESVEDIRSKFEHLSAEEASALADEAVAWARANPA